MSAPYHRRQHQAINAAQKADLTTTAANVIADLTEDSKTGTAPSSYLVDVTLTDAADRLLGRANLTTVDDFASWAADKTAKLLEYMYTSLVPVRPGTRGSDFPVAFAGLVFPGSLEGNPRTCEAPHLKILMIVPNALQGPFEGFLSQQFPPAELNLDAMSLKSIASEKIENSDEAIGLAVDQVLAFTRVWPPIVHRDFGQFVTMFTFLNLFNFEDHEA